MDQKIIVIDASVLAHKSIFAWEMQTILKNSGRAKCDFIMEPDYIYFKSIISLLKKIVVGKDDLVIMALDARNSWRRAFLPEYKGQRNAGRQAHKQIDWTHHYGRIDRMNAILNKATNWHFIKISEFANFSDLCGTYEGQKLNIDDGRYPYEQTFGIEADDLMAACAKFYNQEVVLVTIDADIDQLCYYTDTRVFSPNLKVGALKGAYKIVCDPLKVLSDKIRKGDVSDNILISENDTEQDMEVRKLIINLIELPPFIEEPIIEVLNTLPAKTMSYDDLPFPNSLGKIENFNQIYSPSKQVTCEASLKAHNKRLKKADEKKVANRVKAKEKRILEKTKALR